MTGGPASARGNSSMFILEGTGLSAMETSVDGTGCLPVRHLSESEDSNSRRDDGEILLSFRGKKIRKRLYADPVSQVPVFHTMNTKTIAIAVVAIVVIAAIAGAAVMMSSDDSESEYDSAAYNIISRVNSEGSGLYIKADLLKDGADVPTRADNGVPFFTSDYKFSEANKAAWGGLVIGTPGATSIQHTQIASIASAVGLEFKQLTTSTSKNADTLYYVTNLSNFGTISADNDIDGGIIWEPQYQRVVQEDKKYTELALTNDLFPAHTCCIIAANHNWAQDHSDTVVKFLAGYIDAVNYVTGAIADKSGTDYAWLVEYAQRTVAAGQLSTAEVESALENIDYLYADNASGSLDKLVGDIADLSVSLKDLGFITNPNFTDEKASSFAEKFVDDTYLKKAVAGDASKTGDDKITVAVISGDIHQIAIHVASEKGFFNNYGLKVDIVTGSAGGDIATLLLSGDAQAGFLGAPPATINTINPGHITY